MMPRLLVLAGVFVGIGCCSVSLARDIHVDNLLGNDSFDGTAELAVNFTSGPVRTLRRALELADFSDRVILTRPGSFYYDSLALTGARHSGSPLKPFTLMGNGATLSGLRALPPQGWRKAGPDLWKLTFTRKGFYRLLRDGQPLPEFQPEAGANPLPTLPAGSWAAWQGSVYFHADGELPATQSFAYAADQTGLSLYQVENVRIVDVTFRDFRFDGVRAQNMCHSVTLENVTCTDNGRAGFAISGSSEVDIIGGRAADNGRHQVLISKTSSTVLRELNMEGQPTIVP